MVQRSKNPVKKTKVTLLDISKETGLSITTVSRALRGDQTISNENERVVLEAAQRLGYPIVQRNTPIELKSEIYIAFLLEIFEGEFYSSLMHAFKFFPAFPNVRVMGMNLLQSGRPVAEVMQELKRNNFSAAIVFLPDSGHDDYKHIAKNVPADFPVVSIAPITNPILNTINFDAYGGGHIVAEHFAQKGYQKVGIVRGIARAADAKLRLFGFVDYVETHKEMELVWSYQGDFSVNSGKEAFEHYMNAEVKPRAIFLSNDSMAIGFINAAHAAKVRIPEDVAVVGFDNLQISAYQYPALTSVETNYRALAERAVEHLVQQLHNPHTQTGYTSLIPVNLLVRQSS